MSSSPPSSAPPTGSAIPKPAPSGGKGKDFSRLSAPPSSAVAAAPPIAPPGAAAARDSPGKKGKDLSRMMAGAPSVPSPALQKIASQEGPPSEQPPTPMTKPKGKDLSRMVGVQISPPSQAQQGPPAALAPAVPAMPQQHTNVSQVESLPEMEQQRRQSVARAAAGLPDAPQPSNVLPENIQTTPPSWSEATLSNQNKTQTSKSNTTSTTEQKKYGDSSLAPLLGTKLQTLCHSIDPSYTLDSKVQEMLLEMADGFIDKVTQDALKLAKHRGSTILDVVDVALALKKGYGMDVPGLGAPSAPVGTTAAGNKSRLGGWLFVNMVNASEVEKGAKKKPRLK